MPKQTAVPAVPELQPKVRLYHEAKGNRELLGFAELVIGGSFVIKDITIVRAKQNGNGAGQPFVSFPSKKRSDANGDRWFDVAYPITAEAYRLASEAILNAYQEAAGKPSS